MGTDKRSVLVTGGASGIGYAIVDKLARRGHSVIVVDVNKQALNSSVTHLSEQGLDVLSLQGDISRSEDVDEIFKVSVEKYGGVDILVNNAGITRDNLLMRMSEQDWDQVLNVNLKGAFLCSKAASRIMMKRRWGRIVNVSSVVGVMGNAGQANYAASKAGLIGLTKSLAKEFAGRNITANAVAPGYIETEMTQDLPQSAKESFLAQIPLRRAGKPQDVADLVCFLSSDEAEYITGQVIHCDGGMLM